MREYTDEKLRKLVLDSKKYFQLFMVLSQTPDYPRNLARNAEVSIATMGEMLSNMLRLHLIKRVKKEKGRQQYYEIDWEHGFRQAVSKEFLVMRPKGFGLQNIITPVWIISFSEIDARSTLRDERVRKALKNTTLRNFIHMMFMIVIEEKGAKKK